jgi:SpoVK/Ycf46/Vps4 family AAA+-type ATPase
MCLLRCLGLTQVTWDDIGGLDDVKEQLKETVELPFQNPEAVERLGIIPPRGKLCRDVAVCLRTCSR